MIRLFLKFRISYKPYFKLPLVPRKANEINKGKGKVVPVLN
jgi:hypothetical protein